MAAAGTVPTTSWRWGWHRTPERMTWGYSRLAVRNNDVLFRISWKTQIICSHLFLVFFFLNIYLAAMQKKWSFVTYGITTCLLSVSRSAFETFSAYIEIKMINVWAHLFGMLNTQTVVTVYKYRMTSQSNTTNFIIIINILALFYVIKIFIYIK